MPRSSAAVYRRRRLVAVVGLIVLLTAIGVGVWLFIAQPWVGAEASPRPTSSSTPSDSPTTAPTAGETPAAEPTADETPGIEPCKATDITVAAVTDAEVYPAGVLPKLSISLTNNGRSDCTLDVGSTMQVFTVSSGADVWWRSTDCQENPSSMIATLAAGTTVTSKEPVTWDRTRSSVETCAEENRPRAPGGGASYHVGVSIGGFESQGTQQIILE
ncbi:MAG: hypothetical protein WAK00_12570 [Microbacterium sp.]|uniref:hypothetical protein n=1 Tax=Microbacterium sp. TaxID=51671 RepID=UPI003BB0BCA1